MYYVSKSIYLSSSAYPGSTYLQGVDAHGSFVPYNLNPANSNTSWTVARNASGSYSWMSASSAATVFKTVVKPNGPLATTRGPGWVFGPYSGVFQQAMMSFQLNYAATTVNAQRGLVTYRLWRGPNQNGTGASLITPTYQKSSIIIVNATGNTTTASYLMTSSLSMQNEYIFLETAWGITTAGRSNGCNVIFRPGSGSFFRTGPYEDNTFIPLSDDDIAGYV